MSSDQTDISWFQGLEEEHWTSWGGSDVWICSHKDREQRIKNLVRRYGVEGKDRMAFVLKCSGPSDDVVNPKGVAVDIVPLWYRGETPPKIDQISVNLHTKISLRNSASLKVDQGGQLGMLAVFSK
ncbi:hypothetical protein NCS56_01506400 [Fusarium sp. Ph1]|nr:hypothetical protein NCS56_01506400 [Fusarium sp. Ph1]